MPSTGLRPARAVAGILAIMNKSQGPPYGVLLWGVSSKRSHIITRWLLGGLRAGVLRGTQPLMSTTNNKPLHYNSRSVAVTC